MTVPNQQPSLLEKKPYILAVVITILLIIWMASGMLSAEPKKLATKESQEEQVRPNVEVTQYSTSSIQRSVELYGRTEPDRTLELDAEVEGRVAEILVTEGQFVEAGTVIVNLALEDKLEQLNFAKTLVTQREIEYAGAKSLQSKGLQGESLLAQAKASLEEAKALVKLRESQIEKSQIKAPFAGIIGNQRIELGSFVNKGQALFHLIDISPLVVKAYVTENVVNKIDKDAQVKVLLVDGKRVTGTVRYLSSVSEVGTNTFPIEVEIENPNQQMKAGISTELELLFDEEQAIKVSPALLSLDKDGNLGVKTVVDETVVFTPIDMIKTEQDGVWLGGFSGDVLMITRGQGFVRPGDKVDVTLKQESN